MKIAVIVDSFPKLSETFILAHVTGLLDRGHDVDIFAWELGDLEVQHADIGRYRLLSRLSILAPPVGKLARVASAMKLLLRNGHQSPVRQSLNVKRYGRLAGSLRLLHHVTHLVQDYDVIHCHFGPNGEFAARLKGLGVTGKLVTTFHGYDIRMAQEEGPGIYRTLFEACDALIAISSYNRRHLLEFGADAKRIVSLPLGVDLSQQHLCSPRRDASELLRVISVARMSPEKSLESGVAAVAALKQLRPALKVRYEIIGDGPDRGLVESRIAELGLRGEVTLLGSQNQSVVREALARSHVFLLPSIAEALPMCLMEALGAGLAVVATNVGSVDQIVIDGHTGLIVEPRDVDAIADRLMLLADLPNVAADLGRAGRDHVLREFDHDKEIDSLVHLYRTLIANEPLSAHA